ncbi:hypothetical protein BV898_15149 [Hypsibius exemplaris]|uniref:Uncharacterized protein n=1 Tax=Hypsibius exemplaris TaxID=2072580 RepID=A0A9X6NC29_HYPEX|nr:hypothetical protein BV898_15149 [Hypsibius exemplaris]
MPVCITTDLHAACHAYLAYLRHELEQDKPQPKLNLPQSYPSQQDGKKEWDLPDIPAAARQRINQVYQCSDDIHEKMEAVSAKLRAPFLFRPCGELRHRWCCSADFGQCSQLSAQVYRHLMGLGKKWSEREKSVKELAQKLRTSYPNFGWSVVIFRTKKNVNKQALTQDFVHQELDSPIWHQTVKCQSAAANTRSPSTAPSSTDSVRTPGKAYDYGRMEFYKHANQYALRAVIFWAEKGKLRTAASWTTEECTDMYSSLVNADQHPVESSGERRPCCS